MLVNWKTQNCNDGISLQMLCCLVELDKLIHKLLKDRRRDLPTS